MTRTIRSMAQAANDQHRAEYTIAESLCRNQLRDTIPLKAFLNGRTDESAHSGKNGIRLRWDFAQQAAHHDMPPADLLHFVVDIHRGVLFRALSFVLTVDGAIEAGRHENGNRFLIAH